MAMEQPHLEDDAPGVLVPEDSILRSEFATVSVNIDRTGGAGDRLKITAVNTGRVAFLEPLELWSLADANRSSLTELFDVLVRPA